MGGVVSAGVDNDELVDKLKEADYIRSPDVEKVFRLVDRGNYLTKENQNLAYRDNAWRSGNLHISAPCIYAQVMEGLQLKPGMSFLNIGSGTGYLSTMAGLMIGPNGINHGIELHNDVVEYAKERLNCFIVNAEVFDVSFFCEPQFVQGNALCIPDGVYQYDRVYCGASCPSSHVYFMKKLLKVEGVLIMPRNDQLLKITRTSSIHWDTNSLLPVSFSSLIMPDQTFPPNSLELPLMRITSLQELTREVIRSIFRSRIEKENPELTKAFEYTVPEQSRSDSKDKKQGSCRPSRTFPHVSVSDTEYDSDPSGEESSDERGDGPTFRSHRLQTDQLSAFLELARSFALARNAEDSGRDDDDEDEEEDRNSNDSGNDMIVDDDNDHHPGGDNNLFDMIESVVGRGCRFHENNSRFNRSSSENRNDNDDNAAATSPSKLENDDAASSPGAIVVVTNEKGENSAMALDDPATPQESKKRAAASDSYSGPQTDDEEMVDLGTDECGSQDEPLNLAEGHSDGPSNISNGKKASKREKFDSGIVEDVEPSTGMETTITYYTDPMALSSRLLSRNSRSSSLLSSDSDDEGACAGTSGATGEASNPGTGERNRKYSWEGLGEDSPTKGTDGEKLKWWKKKNIDTRKRKGNTIKFEREFKTDSKKPIEEYSKLMREKINELPLPSPLKIYINYNRHL